jgi:hypothetical protein
VRFEKEIDMAAPCSQEVNRLGEAKDDLSDSLEEYKNALEDYDDAGGFLDDSTLGDAVAVAGAVGACLSNPFSWVVCGIGIAAGGGGIIVSEIGRHDEVEQAEKALERADEKFWKANDRFWNRYGEALDCLSHELAKVP